MKKNILNKKEEGFTLVELLVSLAIFSIVVVASLGAMLTIADTNRKVQKTRAVLDNLSLSIESMSRNLRLGNSYHCEKISPVSHNVPTNNLHVQQDCSAAGGWGDFIAFEDQYGNLADNNDQGYYYLDSNPASLNYGAIMYKRYSGSGPVPLTSNDLKVQSLRFYVTGITPGTQQPKVIISISGITEVGKAKEPVEINIQTTVSQRALNF